MHLRCYLRLCRIPALWVYKRESSINSISWQTQTQQSCNTNESGLPLNRKQEVGFFSTKLEVARFFFVFPHTAILRPAEMAHVFSGHQNSLWTWLEPPILSPNEAAWKCMQLRYATESPPDLMGAVSFRVWGRSKSVGLITHQFFYPQGFWEC